MLYNLRSGKTVELSFDQWLNMTDEDEEYLVAYGHGDDTNSVWRGSSIEHVNDQEVDVLDLLDIPAEEKLADEEFTIED